MSNGDNVPPSQKQTVLHRFVQTAIRGRLAVSPAWPENPFKLSLELAGIYQDFSGPSISELEEQGDISRIEVNGIRYIAEPGDDPEGPTDEILQATKDLYTALENQNRAYFAECVTYVALSKVYEELRENIDIDVLPKGNYPRRFRGYRGELDGLLELRRELFPIEQYNGQKFMTDWHPKMDECEELSMEEEPVSNPLLVSRISSENARDIVFRMNGLIIDAGKIFACEEYHPDLEDTLETLNIRDHFEFLPKFETEDGVELDGRDYHQYARDVHGRYADITPLKMASASELLPEDVMRRFRGGVHLVYVNTFYRRSSDRIDREAALVLQEVYNLLLRSSEGADYQDILEEAWEDFMERYPRLKEATGRKDAILDRTGAYIQRLVSENVVTRRGNRIYARRSDHPSLSLSFSEPNVTTESI